jgi:hypothetical protein
MTLGSVLIGVLIGFIVGVMLMVLLPYFGLKLERLQGLFLRNRLKDAIVKRDALLLEIDTLYGKLENTKDNG